MLTPGCFSRKGQHIFWWVELLPLAARGKEFERLRGALGQLCAAEAIGFLRPGQVCAPDPKSWLVLQKAWVCGAASPRSIRKGPGCRLLPLDPLQSLGAQDTPQFFILFSEETNSSPVLSLPLF